MEYTVMRRGWVLLNDKNKVVAEGNKAEIEKAAFAKMMGGHSVKGIKPADDEPELPIEAPEVT